MGVGEIFDDLKERLEEPAIRWSVVGVVVLILLRFRLVLFAAAVPILVYWHFSSEQRAEEDQSQEERMPMPPQRHRQGRGDEDEDDFDDNVAVDPKPDTNPYDDSFWDEKPNQHIASRGFNPHPPQDDDDDRHGTTGLDSGRGFAGIEEPLRTSMGGGFDDDDIMGSLNLGGGNFDFGLNDMNFMSFGDGGKGKGKNRSDGGKGKGKGDGKRQDGRQIFIGGIGHLDEETIREFFEEHGDIERVKIVCDADTGNSKGFGFVTFRTEEEAERVGTLQAAEIGGRRVTVRLATSGRENGDKGSRDKGEKGDKFGGKGGRGKNNFPSSRDFGEAPQRSFDFGDAPRRSRDVDDSPQASAPPVRAGVADTEMQADREPIDELDEIIQESLQEEESPLKLSDFDAGAKRFLEELRRRDGNRALEALDTVLRQTRSKSRESVRKWPAYVFTLLQKFDKDLADELAEQNIKRKLEEREKRRAEGVPRGGDVARAQQFAPPAQEGVRQVFDRWGKPVVLE